MALAADPVAVGAYAGALALILFAAAWHKLSEPDVFVGVLQEYELLPQATVVLAGRALPCLEAVLGVGVLLPVTRSIGLIAVACLLALYAAAMAINLWRGKRNIDCGCGGEGQPLSWALVVRNAVLAGIAVGVSGPAGERDFEWLDGVTLVSGVLAFYVLYLLVDELLRQATRLRALRTGPQHESPTE